MDEETDRKLERVLREQALIIQAINDLVAQIAEARAEVAEVREALGGLPTAVARAVANGEV